MVRLLIMDETRGSESQERGPVEDGEGGEAAGLVGVAELKPRHAKRVGKDGQDELGQKPRVSAALNVSPETLAPSIEALLLSVDKPVSALRLAEALGLIDDADDPAHAAVVETPAPAGVAQSEESGKPGKKRAKKDRGPTPVGLIQQSVGVLNEQYEQSGRSFRIQPLAGGFRIMTLPKFAPVLENYHGRRERHGVSRAALETLSIIAYKQPISRAGLEAIRGVACGEVLRSLIERRLVTVVGRAEELGRPMLYGTTKAFLEAFGLANLKDLPTAEDLRLGGDDDAEQEAE